MASTSSRKVQAINRGLAILTAAFQSKNSAQQFAQTLDSGDEVPLKAVIDAVVDSEELNWNLLPPEMDDYESLDLAMDSAICGLPNAIHEYA